MYNYWSQPLAFAALDGPALSNTVTATSIINPTEKWVMPAGFFHVNSVLLLSVHGRCSNIVTTPGTLTLSLRTAGGIVIANGGAMALNAVAKTNVSWTAQMRLTCRAIGNGTVANFMFQGEWKSESVVGSAAGVAGTILMPASVPAVGGGFDSTAAQTFDFFATWSIANAGNSIQTHGYVLESLN